MVSNKSSSTLESGACATTFMHWHTGMTSSAEIHVRLGIYCAEEDILFNVYNVQR